MTFIPLAKKTENQKPENERNEKVVTSTNNILEILTNPQSQLAQQILKIKHHTTVATVSTFLLSHC